MFDQIGYYLVNPQAVIYQVSTALLYPVLFAEVLGLAWVLIEAGRFTFEMLQRWRRRSLTRIDSAILAAREALAFGKARGGGVGAGRTHPWPLAPRILLETASRGPHPHPPREVDQ